MQVTSDSMSQQDTDMRYYAALAGRARLHTLMAN
jgi:hypothetical protein